MRRRHMHGTALAWRNIMSHPLLNLFDGAAAIDPIANPAEIEDVPIAPRFNSCPPISARSPTPQYNRSAFPLSNSCDGSVPSGT